MRTDGGLAAQLFAAARDGDVDRIAEALESGTEVDARNEHGHTPLMWASIFGKVPAMERLLTGGAEVDAVDKHGQTALFLAGGVPNARVVRVLARHGADPNAQRVDGCTALHMAIFSSDSTPAVAEALLGAGADPTLRAGQPPGTPREWIERRERLTKADTRTHQALVDAEAAWGGK